MSAVKRQESGNTIGDSIAEVYQGRSRDATIEAHHSSAVLADLHYHVGWGRHK